MKREEAKKIIIAEQLTSFCFFEKRNNFSNEMVIKKVDNSWIVYATDDRASEISSGEKKFDSEELALENFIKRLRALNNYLRALRN